jgi:asparagine synthase (glutamine-hydrolysing)
MSAIAGIWDRRQQLPGDSLPWRAAAMADPMVDSRAVPGRPIRGAWHDAAAGFAFACRAPQANHPVVSSCGRFVLACQGEIYNAGDLARQLRDCGRQVTDSSASGVLVETAAVSGVCTMLQRLDGGMAGALWDRERRVLHLFCDRFGRQALYWHAAGGTILFASELKALRAYPGFPVELDRDVVATYLRCRYVPGPSTVYRGAQRLEPGTVLAIDADGSQSLYRYYSLEEVAIAGQSNRFAGDADEAMAELERLLSRAMNRRLALGPAGIFLSGGIDSSLLLALGQSIASGSVRSFSAGFREAGYDEAADASALASHLGARHYSLYVSGADIRDIVPTLPDICDEPLADASLLPSCLLAMLAGLSVPAVITGDGAEPLGVYNRYLSLSALERYVDRLPSPAHGVLKALIRATPILPWSRIPVELPIAAQPVNFAEKARLLARLLTSDADGAYHMAVSHWHDARAVVIGAREPASRAKSLKEVIADDAERLEYLGMASIMPGCIMPKLARTASSSGLSIRSPFLDEQLVAFGWSLPCSMKRQAGVNKWLQRRLLYRYVPAALVDRPKTGFDAPLGSWLRGPLRDWAETLLGEQRLSAEGIFHPAPIRRLWRQHLEGRRNWQSPLWVVLVFQAWQERWRG